MLDSLYTEAIIKRDSIRDNIDEMFEGDLDIESNWTNCEIRPSSDNPVIAAGDGSFNKKKYLGFNFYAVAAESLIYDPKKGLDTIETVELDTVPHQTFADDMLRNMMGIFEIKTALKSFKEFDIDYYMVDGSILGDLIRPVPLERRIPSEIKSSIIKKIQEKLQKEEEFNELFLSLSEFTEEYNHHFKSKRDKIALITFFESIENLVVLRKLLNYRKNIIAVSKTSTTEDLFHANVSDMAILDRFTTRSGISEPFYKKVNTEAKRDFPVFNTSFRDMWFTIFFTRLEDNANMLKIELPYHASKEEIKKITEILKENSTDGYPFLLKRAHHDVVIKNKDIENLSNIIEVLDRSGREMLD